MTQPPGAVSSATAVAVVAPEALPIALATAAATSSAASALQRDWEILQATIAAASATRAAILTDAVRAQTWAWQVTTYSRLLAAEIDQEAVRIAALPEYSLAQLATHNSQTDLWVAIDGLVVCF